MSSIIVREANGDHRVLESKPFAYEEVLKDSIIDLPSLIPLDSVTDAGVTFLILGEEWPAGGGRADVVLVGSDGILTIVETKLSRNPEARREVVAQVLEYAAYISESTIFDIQRQADEFYKNNVKCPDLQRGRTLDENLKSFLEKSTSEMSLDSFKESVEDHLRSGRLRLIVAVDDVGEQAQKIVTFVNSFSTFELYLLQVSAFQDKEERQIFVPSLHGYARKVRSRAPGVQWDWNKYLEAGWAANDVEVGKQLIERLELIARDWQPKTRFLATFVTIRCFGKSLFGVEPTAKRGFGMWWELDSDPGVALPQTTQIHQTSTKKKYLYLHGNLVEVSDSTLRQLCEASLKQADLLPTENA